MNLEPIRNAVAERRYLFLPEGSSKYRRGMAHCAFAEMPDGNGGFAFADTGWAALEHGGHPIHWLTFDTIEDEGDGVFRLTDDGAVVGILKPADGDDLQGIEEYMAWEAGDEARSRGVGHDLVLQHFRRYEGFENAR